MILIKMILMFSFFTLPPVHQEGRSTFYSNVESGKKTADGSEFIDMKLGLAHRSLPLYTYVRVENRDASKVICIPVLDRGPYGATTSEGVWFIKAKKWNPKGLKGPYNGIADLSYGAALKFHGLSPPARPPNTRIKISYWNRHGKTKENCEPRISSTFNGAIYELTQSIVSKLETLRRRIDDMF